MLVHEAQHTKFIDDQTQKIINLLIRVYEAILVDNTPKMKHTVVLLGRGLGLGTIHTNEFGVREYSLDKLKQHLQNNCKRSFWIRST